MATNDHEIVTKVSRTFDSIESYERKIVEFMKGKDEGDPSNAGILKLRKDLEDIKGELENFKETYNRLGNSKKRKIDSTIINLLNTLSSRFDRTKCQIDKSLQVLGGSGGSNQDEVRTEVSELWNSIEMYERKIKIIEDGHFRKAGIEKLKEDFEDLKGALKECREIYNRIDDSQRGKVDRTVKDMLKILKSNFEKMKRAIDIAVKVPTGSTIQNGGKGKEIIGKGIVLDKSAGGVMKRGLDKQQQRQENLQGVSLKEQVSSGDLEGFSSMDSLQMQVAPGDLDGVSPRDSLEVQVSSGDLEVISSMDDLEVELSGDREVASTMADLGQQEVKGNQAIGSPIASKYPDDIEKQNRLQLTKYLSQLERRIIDLDREKKELENMGRSLNWVSLQCHQSDDSEIKAVWKRFEELKIEFNNIKDVSSSALEFGFGSSDSGGPSKDEEGSSKSGDEKMGINVNKSAEQSGGSGTGIEGRGKEVLDVVSDSVESELQSDSEEDMLDFLKEMEKYEELEELR